MITIRIMQVYVCIRQKLTICMYHDGSNRMSWYWVPVAYQAEDDNGLFQYGPKMST